MAFIDDDISFSSDALEIIDEKMAEHPLAIVGVRSYIGKSRKVDKPKKSQYPYFKFEDIVFGPVIGNFVATYTAIIKEIGGFDPKRRNWGEWIDLNFRLINQGYLPGYVINGASLQHFVDTLDSPTRDKKDRNFDILRGIVFTALEYGLTDSKNNKFWQIVYNRYLHYAYDRSVEKEILFFDLVKVFNLIVKDSIPIPYLPLKHKPYEPMSKSNWLDLYASSKDRLKRYSH